MEADKSLVSSSMALLVLKLLEDPVPSAAHAGGEGPGHRL